MQRDPNEQKKKPRYCLRCDRKVEKNKLGYRVCHQCRRYTAEESDMATCYGELRVPDMKGAAWAN